MHRVRGLGSCKRKTGAMMGMMGRHAGSMAVSRPCWALDDNHSSLSTSRNNAPSLASY